jgi:hypothetical protein
MKNLLPILILITFIGGCGGHDVYREEAFAAESPYRKQMKVPAEQACKGAQLALLSQGYRLEKIESNLINGIKDFQPVEDIHAIVEFNIVCRDYSSGSMVFANAVQTKFELKKSSKSLNLGISSSGSVSLPWGKTTEGLVKIASETISDEDFYSRFFALVQAYLAPAPK